MKRTLMLAALSFFALGLTARAETFDRKWEIHLIHHTHFDIGYTEPQEEVLARQRAFLDQALDLIDQTRDNPPGDRFCWNPENNYATESWIEQASPEDRARFIRAVQDGQIGLSGDFANMLWELCRPAELMQAMAYKYDLERLTGVTVDAAMLSDVPGMPWGLVSAFAQNGIKYFSVGPNRGDRIGYVLKDWGDKPFYWTSPSGRDKVLVFIHGKGYSWFHAGGNHWDKLPILFTESRIFPYLKDLEKEGYPYAIIPIRYNVGADNGPPDPRIAQAVLEWNQRNPDVQVKLTTVSESFHEFEARYGDQLPTYSGDFSPYWADGAASTARETAWVRNAGEELTQAQTLHALTGLNRFPAADFHLAWNDVLLYNEHTWGAWSSISAPDSEFTRTQWEWKRLRAEESKDLAAGLLRSALTESGPAERVTVTNTNSFAVTAPVRVTQAGDRAAQGAPSQGLSNGDLLIMARVEGLSTAAYQLAPGPAQPAGACVATTDSITNGRFTTRWDPKSGAIVSLVRNADGREFVNRSFNHPLNDYVYVRGRRPALAWLRDLFLRSLKTAKVTVKDPGPLACSVEIERPAPGSNSLVTTITMYDGLDRIDLVNTLDRPVQRRPEAVHFAFPVAAANPRVRYDVAWGVVEVDRDQLKGSCKNFFVPARWVDVAGDDGGLMVVLQDAPLFEAGAITNDANRVGWLRETKHNGVIYSFAMNNYWHTNYKADQPGVTSLRYSIFPHDSFDPAANSRHALEVMEPPRVGRGELTNELKAPLLTNNDAVIIETVVPSPLGEGIEVDLANLTGEDQSVDLTLGDQCPRAFLMSNGRDLAPVDGALKFGRYDMVRLVCK